MEPLEYDSDRESPGKSSPIVPPPPGMDDQTDEEKKYILEKIQQANRELQDQEAPDMTRRRRLHFKETLVDLVVAPLQFEKSSNGDKAEGGKSSKAGAAEADTDVSGKLSELRLSPRNEGSIRTGESEVGQGMKEGKVLVEKDGKFDFVTLKEVESQSLLPPIAHSYSKYSRSSPRVQEHNGNLFRNYRSSSSLHQSIDNLPAPRPPAQPRNRPSSAGHSQTGRQRKSFKRRVQSAMGTPCQATYTLSPQQKELLQKIQERKEKLAREVGR